MNQLLNVLLFIMSMGAFKSALASQTDTRAELFKKLSDIHVDQVVEIPYNRSLISQLSAQVKIYSLELANEHYVPEPLSLLDMYNESTPERYGDRDLIPQLFYKVSDKPCGYYEAVRVSNTLVCYKRAYENSSMLALIQAFSDQRCTSTRSQLSHCYIFAHRVDDVVRAIEENS